MTNKKIGFVVLAAVALALVFLIPSWNKPSSVIAAPDFPITTGNRVELPPQAGEEIRYVYFQEDGVTKSMTQIEFRSGVTSFTSYRADGTKKETRAFFPLPEGAKKRQLRSLVTYDDNGVSYKSHQVYREDGSLERNGGRLSDGGYQTLYFNGEDGSVQRRLVYSATSALQQEERFSDEGKLVEKSEKVSEYELKTTRWSDDGKLLSVISDYTDGRREGKLYYEDGETVKTSFRVGYQIEVEYFDKAGSLELGVTYVTEGMMVTAFGADEKPLYKQNWAILGGKTLCDAQFRLVSVMEYQNQTNRYNFEVKRVIGIADDGKTPNRVVVPLKGQYSYERTDAMLHPDGSVMTLTEYSSSNQVTSTKNFAPGAEKIALPANLFVKPTFECLDPPESKVKSQEEPVEGQDED